MVSASFVILVSLLGLSGVFSNIADYDCFERPDGGPGRGYFEVYAWNPSEKKCTQFVYGGLVGNRNRFETSEQCQRACHDAVLRDQLKFKSGRRYSAVNRFYETVQLALKIEQLADGYFKLITQPSEKILGVNNINNQPVLESQESNNDETQQWDIVPTGEKGYYRIKTRSKLAGHMDFMFLQAAPNAEGVNMNLARRDDANLGQQWRLA